MPQVVTHGREIGFTWQHINLFGSIEFSKDNPDIDMAALAARYADAEFSTCTIQKCNSVRVVFAKFCFGASNKAGKQLKKHLVLS